MSEPVEPTLNNLGSGTLGAVVMALLGLIYKLITPRLSAEPTANKTEAPTKSAIDERIEALQHRVTVLEATVTHIDHKVDNISVDIARAAGEIGSIAASVRGGSNGRVR
jgi:peptidoglycan hydrolase CwlO-like protein